MLLKTPKNLQKVKHVLNPTSSQTTTREKKKNNMKQGKKTSSREKHKSEKAKEEEKLNRQNKREVKHKHWRSKEEWKPENKWQKAGQTERSPPKGTERNGAVHHRLNTNHWYLWSDGQLMARPHPRSSGHITKGGNQAERGNARCSSWGRESVEDQKLRLSLPTCWKLHFLAVSHAYRPVMSPPCVHSGALQVSHSEWPYLTYSDFHSMEKNTMEVNGYQQLLVTNILQNIFFCVQQNKEIHTGLEQHEGEYMMTITLKTKMHKCLNK